MLMQDCNITTAKQRLSWLKDRLKAGGFIESAYSRTKIIGYSNLHNIIFVGRCGNYDLSHLQNDLKDLQFTALPTLHHENMKVMQFTSFVNVDDVHVCINHSSEEEVISVTIQYLGD